MPRTQPQCPVPRPQAPSQLSAALGGLRSSVAAKRRQLLEEALAAFERLVVEEHHVLLQRQRRCTARGRTDKAKSRFAAWGK